MPCVTTFANRRVIIRFCLSCPRFHRHVMDVANSCFPDLVLVVLHDLHRQDLTDHMNLEYAG